MPDDNKIRGRMDIGSAINQIRVTESDASGEPRTLTRRHGDETEPNAAKEANLRAAGGPVRGGWVGGSFSGSCRSVEPDL